MRHDWHRLTVSRTAEQLGADPITGLAPTAVAERLARHGPNQLTASDTRSLLNLLLDQFRDFMILVLIAAAVISGLVGELADSIAIMVIVVLNAAIGLVQAYRAEQALAALKRLATPTVKVRRDGRLAEIPAADLVPGDLLIIETGNLVPADIRLTRATSLKVNEAALTGESAAVEKHTDPLEDPAPALGDCANLLFSGTSVVYGHGEGLVVATGMATEIGHIAALLTHGERPATPLQQRLSRFGRRLGLIVLGVCLVILVSGLLRGIDPLLMFMTAISLAVAAIPEALPAVVTISLALGAYKLVRQQALIRQLPAVETLGSVTVICADKTGTLTQNRMHVEAWLHGPALRRADAGTADPQDMALLRAFVLNNDCETDVDHVVHGEPTEAALLQAAIDKGLSVTGLRNESPRVDELPFDAERKMMTTVHADGAGFRSLTKGAPERVLARCTRARGREDLPDQEAVRRSLLQESEKLAAEGYRVLAFAQRDWQTQPTAADRETLEQDLTFLGLVALLDPPRPEARAAVATCRTAGIVPVMITGDHPVTARAIAQRLDIARPDDQVLTGAALDELSDAALQEQIATTAIYARVAPEQKIRIVKAWQARGEFVAMTGDGVNDAPALRSANIGIAMGLGGTDVARQAAHMVLLDDNFATIVSAIREGRRIFDNVRKFIRYTMTSNAGEIWTLSLAPLLGMPLPLLPIQILWINLVTDGLPGLALSLEPHERGIMRRAPRAPREPILSHGLGWHVLWIGLLIGVLSIGAQAWALGTGNPHWQTLVFNVLTFAQLFHVLAIRSERESLWRLGLLSNPALLGAVGFTFTLQLAVTYTPILQGVFNTQSLSGSELLGCVVLAALVIPAVELEKALARRGLIYRTGPAEHDH